MFKNVASQKIALFAFDTTTGAAKTGDAANITVYVSKDFGAVTVLGDTSATEMDATNAKGWYLFDLTQVETNADALLFTGKSVTANISVVGQLIYTLPASFTSFVTPPTAAAIADQVWDEILSGHAIGGSTGEALTLSATPWNQFVADWTTAGTFGKAIGDLPTAVQNADALLDRNMATGVDSGSPSVRTVRQSLRANRNKVSISGATVTVTKEDDTTASWTASLTTDAAALPIIGIDPA